MKNISEITLQNIESPNRRAELIFNIKDLADRQYQRRVWLNMGHPYSFWREIYSTVDFLYNDLDLDEQSERFIDYLIRSQTEAKLINKMMRAFDQILKYIDQANLNYHYWDLALWQQLVD